MRISRGALPAVALATAFAGTGAASGASGGAVPAGEIVFASTRATASPGALYALAPGVAPRGLASRAVTSLGLATSPAGAASAYWSNQTGPFRLVISQRPGGERRTVVIPGRAGTDPQYPSTPPAFSPDGRRLLISYHPAASPTPQLRFALADVRSGPARPLGLPCGEPPVWSPDGALLACTDVGLERVLVDDLAGHVRFSVPGTALFWSSDGRLAVAGAARTAILNAQGRVLQQVAGVARAWSPDGRYLVLTRGRALVLAQPGRAADRVVARGPAGVQYFWFGFTPDGRDLGYAAGTGAPQLVPVAGGPARALPAGFGFLWSRDGRLAFVVASGTRAAVEIGDRSGGHARVVARLPFDDHGLLTLAWLGDGSRLLANVSTRDHADLWTMNADGAAQRRLTSAGERIAEPAWSADGTRLAFDDAPFSGGNCGYCGGSVVVAGADGRARAAVPGDSGSGESADMSPSWSPAGTRLAVSNAFNGGVFAVGLDGSGRTRLAADASASPAWSPDGATVAYIQPFGGGAIWGVDATGANPRRLLPSSRLKALAVTWSPDGRLLAFPTSTGIFVAPADGSAPPRRVSALPGDVDHPRLGFSPDGAWIAFTAAAGTTHPYSAIFVARVDGSGLRRLTAGPFDSFDPAWRPASR